MAQKTKKWWESKTVWLGIITTIIGILTFIETQGEGLSLTMTAVGILNIILRTFTTADEIK
jgi:hypothetical protein